MPGKYLSCFFKDLESKLAQWAGINLSDTKLGTIDSRVDHSHDWDTELSRGLSENRAFLAIITPLYFKRPNCGKELAAFVQRSPGLGIDPNGALIGVQNLMVLRWLPEDAYAANGVRNSLIPPILRRIEDTPADDGGDDERSRAIERYRKKGMEKCVTVEPHYGELLDLFAACIRDMQVLPPPNGRIDFATAPDAFRSDWINYIGAVGASGGPVPQEAPATPQKLSSIVAFYVTRRPFTTAPIAVNFADRLIAEPLPGASTSIDDGLAALLADVRVAGVAETLTVFHAAADPVLPASPDSLVKRLEPLSSKGIVTTLIIDPDIWPGLRGAGDATVEQILRSLDWTGPALVPAVDDRVTELEKLVAARGLRRQVAVLPQPSEERVAKLRSAFVGARGGALRASVKPAPGAERVPLPSGVARERG